MGQDEEKILVAMGARPHSEEKSPLQRTMLAHFLTIALYVLVFCVILSFFNGMVWWADLLCHLRLHLTVAIAAVFGGLAALSLSSIRDVFRPFLIGGAAVILNISSIISQGTPLYADLSPTKEASVSPLEESTAKNREIKIVSYNVNADSDSPGKLVEWLNQIRPDVAVLIEINRVWQSEIDQLSHLFPYQVIVDSASSFGMAILSGFPLENQQTDILGLLNLPTVSADIEAPFGKLCLVAVHPPPPLSATEASARNLYLNQVAAMVRTRGTPCVIAGDFNATPWSSGFETLRTLPNLQPALWRAPATWPAMLGFMGVPLDHILYTAPMNEHAPPVSVEVSAGSLSIGSNHRPVIARLSLEE